MVAARHQARLISIALEGKMTEAGLLAAANGVLHARVRSVAGLEELGGLAGGAGGQELVAPAVDGFEEGQLRAGVGFFAAADDAHLGGPARQLVATRSFPQQGGELDDPGLAGVAGLALWVEDGGPGGGGDQVNGRAFRAPSSQPME
jgi:hypothetical protein